MDLHPDRRRHRNVGQEYDPGLVVSASHGWNAIPSGGMDLRILDHHAAHVVDDDDCDDDPERCSHDPALCTGDALRSKQRSTWERRCTGRCLCCGLFADVVRLFRVCYPTAQRVLMALLFVGGIMNVLWIAVLATVVLLEKLAPQGPWFARITGIVLLVWGAATLGA